MLILTLVTLICYAFASGRLMTTIFNASHYPRNLVLSLVSIALVSHIALFASQTFTHSGQNFSLVNVIFLVSFIISLSITLVSIKHPTALLQSVSYGFSALIMLASLFIPQHITYQDYFQTSSLAFHVTLSLAAYCLLIITALYAIQANVINKRLKRKDLRIMHSALPPLMVVERQQFQLLTIGTIALSISLLTGFVYLDNMFSKEFAHKTVFSILAWCIFSITVWGHKFQGWRGNKTVIATVVGAALLTLGYFGSRFVREFLLT